MNALDVKKNIKKRRGDLSEVITDHRTKANRFLDGLEDVVLWMTAAVISMLAETSEELNTSGSDFRVGMQKCLRRLLAATAQKAEKVVFFHEAIPGFVVLAIKKEGWGEDQPLPAGKTKPARSKAPNGATELAATPWDAARNEAMKAIIDAYVQRTGNRVMAIEGADLVLVLFPVADLKKNLREMGFWTE